MKKIQQQAQPSNPATASASKKDERGPLQRIEDLERMMQTVVSVLNRTMQGLDKKLGALEESVEVLGLAIGHDKVRDVIEKRLLEAEVDRTEKAKAWLAEALADKVLAPADVVSEGSLIVGTEFGEDGKEVGVGYTQVSLDGLLKDAPQFVAAVLGKGPGHRELTPSGNTFEIRAIYEKCEPPAPVVTIEPKADPLPIVDADLDDEIDAAAEAAVATEG